VEATSDLQGIRGWLLLIAFHLLFGPIGFLVLGFTVARVAFDAGNWESLTVPGAVAYHPAWAPALLFQLCYVAVGLPICMLLLALFFRKRAAWRPTYAAFLLALLVAAAIDLVLTRRIPAAADAVGPAVKELMRSGIAAALWIPYCFRSVRARATFRR
jgi:hypothetical protein